MNECGTTTDTLPLNIVKNAHRYLPNGSGRLDLITNELSETIEYRKKGRKIHQRTITLSPSFTRKENDNKKKEVIYRESELIQIMYVHGLCANSSQFNSVIDAIGNQLLHENNDDKDIKRNMIGIQNTLFDALGFGKSYHDPLDYNAYSEEESMQDLKSIYQSIASKGCPTYIISHSYGVSQVLKLMSDLSSSSDKSLLDNLSGVIFISGGLIGNTSTCANICNGGSALFRLPIFALKLLQPELTAKFVQQAYHPSSSTTLKDCSWDHCINSNMNIVKAYHRQTNWSTKYDAALVMVKSLVIHGEDDLIMPLQCGKHLAASLINSNFVVVPETRHQVFEEKPEFVAKKIISFVQADLK